MALDDFKYLGTNEDVTEKTDLTEYLEVSQDSTVRYSENVKLIIDFEDSEYKLLPGEYSFGINILDGANEQSDFESSIRPAISV